MAEGTEREYGKLYPAARAVLLPIFHRLWKFTIEGLENVPEQGGAIMCPNHTSVIDSFFLPCALPRRITFVGKAEYMDSWKTKHLFPALGMIPIDRGGGSASQRALDTAARVIEDGELFGIYPEGTRARDGKLHKGHTGPARLALRTGAPIVPVGIIGTREVQPPDARFPKPRLPVTIRFGRPVRPERYAGRDAEHLVLRQVIDEVMFEIRELTGQEYVDQYATKKADSLPTEVAQVPSRNGSRNGNGNRSVETLDLTDAPRRSSADVLRSAQAPPPL